jgi:hypothetical protein
MSAAITHRYQQAVRDAFAWDFVHVHLRIHPL